MLNIIIAIVVLAGVGIIANKVYHDEDKQKRIERARQRDYQYSKKCEEEKAAYKQLALECDSKYGPCTKSIIWWCDKYTNLLRVYDKAKVVLIKDQLYNFHSIVGVDYVEGVQEYRRTHPDKNSNSSDVMKRALVGGIIAGKIGALIGAATSKSPSHHDNGARDYIISIYTNIDSKPVIKLEIGADYSQMEDIVATIRAIVDQNTRDAFVEPLQNNF